MSKFDELHQAYVDARRAFFARRDASIASATAILEGLERYLECPRTTLSFLSRSGGTSLLKTHKAEEAVWLGPDGLWRFSIGLDLSEVQAGGRRETAKQTVVVEVVIQPTDTGFSIGLKGWNKQFDLPKDTESAEYAAFYEFVFQHIIESYQKSGQRFFESLADSKRAVDG